MTHYQRVELPAHANHQSVDVGLQQDVRQDSWIRLEASVRRYLWSFFKNTIPHNRMSPMLSLSNLEFTIVQYRSGKVLVQSHQYDREGYLADHECGALFEVTNKQIETNERF